MTRSESIPDRREPYRRVQKRDVKGHQGEQGEHNVCRVYAYICVINVPACTLYIPNVLFLHYSGDEINTLVPMLINLVMGKYGEQLNSCIAFAARRYGFLPRALCKLHGINVFTFPRCGKLPHRV